MATARFLERARRAAPDARRAWSSPRRCRSTARASTTAPSTAASRPGPRPEEQLLARAVGAALPDVRTRARAASATRETKPLIPTSIYAITKRDHEELCLVDGRRLRHPDRRAALLQRLRPGPGAVEPVHRRRRDLRLAPAQRPPAGHLRGRRAVARLHPRQRHRRRASCSRSSPTRPSATRSTSAPAGPTHRRRGRAGARGRPRLDDRADPQRPVPRRRHPPLLRRPDRARASCSASRRSDARGRHARAGRVARRTRRPSTASTTPPRSSPRAASPARRRDVTDATDQADLAIIIVSTNEAQWLAPCLSTRLRARGRRRARRGRRRQRVDRRHARARRSRVPAGARRRLARTAASPTPTTAALMTCDARYVLFLNPDTEIVDGHVRRARRGARRAARRRAGRRAAGHRPTARCGRRSATSRASGARSARPSAPSAGRCGRGGPASASSTSRVYEQRGRVRLDLGLVHVLRGARRSLSAGLLDERFFIYSEEPDLCLRMKRAGWAIRHLPAMTIVHHAGKGGLRPKMIAQDVFTRRQYAAKHFVGAARAAVPRRRRRPARDARRRARGRSRSAAARGGAGWRCARSPAARRRRSARRRRPRSAARAPASRSAPRRRRRSAARAPASRVADRRPQPPVRVACRGERFRGRIDRALRGGRSVVPTRHAASETT